MFRTSLMFILTSLASIGGFLFFQWQDYVTALKHEDEEQVMVDQTIEVTYRDDKLYIKQTLYDLPEGTYTVTLPTGISEASCINSEGQACERWKEGEERTSFTSSGNVTITYHLRVQRNTEPLIKNWYAQFSNLKILHTVVQLSDESKQEGTWVVSGKRTSFIEKNYINFYRFETAGTPSSLYWHESPMVMNEWTSTITVYTPTEFTIKAEEWKKFLEQVEATIIMSDIQSSTDGKLYFFRNEQDFEQLQYELAFNYVNNRFDFLEEEKWLASVVSSLLADEKSNHSKANLIVQELKDQLTEKTYFALIDSIIAHDGELSAERLDNMIYELTGLKTNFFQENKQENVPFRHFLLFDGRKLQVNGRVLDKEEAVYFSGRRWYPFLSTMQALGYETRPIVERESYIVKQAGNVYRLYLDETFFIFNEESFGLTRNPLTELNEEIFIDEAWLEKIFRVYISHLDETILIEKNF